MSSKDTCLVSIPAGSLLPLTQLTMFLGYSSSSGFTADPGARHRCVCLCDGWSGSDVIRHVLTLDSTSVRGIFSPQYLLLGLTVDLSALLP